MESNMPCPYTLDGGQLLGQGLPTKGHILKENQLSILSWGGGLVNPFLFHAKMLTGLILGRQPQLPSTLMNAEDLL